MAVLPSHSGRHSVAAKVRCWPHVARLWVRAAHIAQDPGERPDLPAHARAERIANLRRTIADARGIALRRNSRRSRTPIFSPYVTAANASADWWRRNISLSVYRRQECVAADEIECR